MNFYDIMAVWGFHGSTARAKRLDFMKKPFLRVTKWLGDIPVEAVCTSCALAKFRAQSASHRPQREEYQKSLQAQFEGHCKSEHSDQQSIPAVQF